MARPIVVLPLPDSPTREKVSPLLMKKLALWTATNFLFPSPKEIPYLGFIEGIEDQKVVFLELGVGYNTPTIIRYPFEKMTAVFPKANLIRLNRDDLEGFAATKGKTISINDDMREVLQQWLAD